MGRFVQGDRVRIDARSESRHHRVPAYVKGRVGFIERRCQAYGRPEDLSLGTESGPPEQLYRVSLRQADLWPDYTGGALDTLEIEIFQHWLEPAPETP